MIPWSGEHAGHDIRRGFCGTCERYLTHADHLAVACPLENCSAPEGRECRRGFRERDLIRMRHVPVHEERKWLAEGHDPSAFAALRDKREASSRAGSRRVRAERKAKLEARRNG